jgi:hypothetical protein
MVNNRLSAEKKMADMKPHKRMRILQNKVNLNYRKTQKKYLDDSLLHIKGEYIGKKEGWIIFHIYGEPYERGYAHGYLLSDELKDVKKKFEFIVKKELNQEFDVYYSKTVQLLKPILMENYPEYFEELRGISSGARKKGVDISIDYLIAWNGLLSMYNVFHKKDAYKCSAFIATGSATQTGEILMAHNTHTDFITGKIQNIILYVTPDTGYPFVMQTSPGYIASGTDWFLCGSGIIGCETTISRIDYVPEFGSPFFCRIREAMQYGDTLDKYVEIMKKENAGDYACSWMFGDVNTNEIMLLELGKKEFSVMRTTNGVYYGMNTAIDLNVRGMETTDRDLYNIHTSSGARNIRLNYLLNDLYYGKLNLQNAKSILADHYDVAQGKNIMNQRGICKHSEMESIEYARTPNYPFGCTDGKVVNSEMAREMTFLGRFGSCCGRIFDAKKHIENNPIYKDWKPFLENFPRTKWTKIQSIGLHKKHKYIKNKTHKL